MGDLSAVLANEGAAGQGDVATAPSGQEPGKEVGGEPVTGIGEADLLPLDPPHPKTSNVSLSAVIRLGDLGIEIGPPRPTPAGPR